jgi:hypothetical protein
VDRQFLLRVLVDPSRYSVYYQLARGDRPLTIGELAERLDLQVRHPARSGSLPCLDVHDRLNPR